MNWTRIALITIGAGILTSLTDWLFAGDWLHRRYTYPEIWRQGNEAKAIALTAPLPFLTCAVFAFVMARVGFHSVSNALKMAVAVWVIAPFACYSHQCRMDETPPGFLWCPTLSETGDHRNRGGVVSLGTGMRQTGTPIPGLLDKLERFYGKQEPCWPLDPYEFLVWWHCGYPASDAACTKGWEALKASVDIAPIALLKVPQQKLSSALRAGGMVPDLRALCLKEIAMRVQDEFSGDLRMGLAGALPEMRKILKSLRPPNTALPSRSTSIIPSAAIKYAPHVGKMEE